MSLLSFESISKSFAANCVLSGMDLSVEEGEFSVLFGASGTGKSVLLRMLVGLETPDSGVIRLRGIDASTLKPGQRNVGYVPQSFALFPSRSVHDNIAYPLTIAKESTTSTNLAVGKMAELLDIADLLDRTPDQLSGGQKQRVAIARGLVRPTELYVLDDPLVGLDFKLRERLVDDLRNTREALGATFLYATSDPGEALALGSTVSVLVDGKVCEHGPPYELYRNPRRAETMSSLCFPPSNRVPGELRTTSEGNEFSTPWGAVAVSVTDPGEVVAGEVVAIVRPEHIDLAPVDDGAGPAGLKGKAMVALREDLGAEEVVYLESNDQRISALVRTDSADLHAISPGEWVDFGIAATHLVLFRDGDLIGRGRS